MPVRHRIDTARGVVLVDLSGVVTRAELFAYYAALAEDPALRPGLVVLADCRRVTSSPSFAELHAVANARARLPVAVRPAKAAILVNNGWLYGIVRQFAAMIERLGLHVLPFADESDAFRWLNVTHEPRTASRGPSNLGEHFDPKMGDRSTDAA